MEAKHAWSECPDDAGVTDRRNNPPWQNNMSHILWTDSQRDGYFVWAVSYLTWKNKPCCKHDINVRIKSWEVAGESCCVLVDYLSVVFFFNRFSGKMWNRKVWSGTAWPGGYRIGLIYDRKITGRSRVQALNFPVVSLKRKPFPLLILGISSSH